MNKVMKAPEKIYVPTAGDELHYHMACPNNEFQESIEYTRTDAFIEKAVQYLKNHKEDVETEDNGIIGWIPDYFIEDFKNYMKGE